MDGTREKLLDKGYYDINSVPVQEAFSLIDKEYVQRYKQSHDYNLGETVLFDNFKNEGIIVGKGAGTYIINSDGMEFQLHGDKVFLKSEMTRFGHWDVMSDLGQMLLLKGCGIKADLVGLSWNELSKTTQDIILKLATPAGFEGGNDLDGGYNTNSTGTYNPVSENKPLSQILEEDSVEEKN